MSAEEQQIYDDLEGLMYKYRYEDENEEAGMFGDESVRVNVDSIADICREMSFDWDPAVLAILKPEQKAVDFATLKLLFKTLLVSKCGVSIYLSFLCRL